MKGIPVKWEGCSVGAQNMQLPAFMTSAVQMAGEVKWEEESEGLQIKINGFSKRYGSAV